MAPSTRDAILIALYLVMIVLINARSFYRGDTEMSSWAAGVATGLLIAAAVVLGGQIIKRAREKHRSS